MECLYLAPFREGERPPAAPIHWLDFDDDWTDAPELGPLARIFNQDSFNLPMVQRITLGATTGVTMAVYQETKVRHFHALYDWLGLARPAAAPPPAAGSPRGWRGSVATCGGPRQTGREAGALRERPPVASGAGRWVICIHVKRRTIHPAAASAVSRRRSRSNCDRARGWSTRRIRRSPAPARWRSPPRSRGCGRGTAPVAVRARRATWPWPVPARCRPARRRWWRRRAQRGGPRSRGGPAGRGGRVPPSPSEGRPAPRPGSARGRW